MILLAALLLALIVCLIVMIRTSVVSSITFVTPETTQFPIQELPFMTETTPMPNPNPTATPSDDDRKMPALDGIAPYIMSDESNPIPDIFESVSSSVVGVINYTMQHYGTQDMLAIYGTGSGFIVSSEGYVLTNAHVVEDAQRVTVMLSSGEELDAIIVGADTQTDVAVLKVEKDGLKALSLGNSDDVRVGEFVLAIGNPLDLETLTNTLTYGIVSATNRQITIDGHTNEYVQTDAAINYGNSGGPLLNLNGEVIGMNSAKSVTAGYDAYGNAVSAEGIGFALPINTVVEIMQKLVTYGTIERPAVGITVVTLTETMAAQLDVQQGIYVQSVVKGSPASAAGIKAGDVIVGANGKKVLEKEELIEIINSCEIGDSIELELVRKGETIKCTVQLGNKTAMDFNDTDPNVTDTD